MKLCIACTEFKEDKNMTVNAYGEDLCKKCDKELTQAVKPPLYDRVLVNLDIFRKKITNR